MSIISVRVTNKVPRLVNQAKIVCNNSDYQIVFSFDSEWSEFTTKTARFIWNGEYADVSFTGNTVAVPMLQNTTGVYVGLYAGDLHTTEAMYIPCEPSIICKGGTEAEAPGPIERGLPAGGSAGQVLSKASGESYDVEWMDPAAGGGSSVTVDAELIEGSENPVQSKVIQSALAGKVGTEELNENSETLGTLTVKDSDGNVLGVYDGGSKEIVIPASTGGGGSHAWNLITNLSVSDAQAEHQITVDDSGNAFAYDEILVWYPSPAVSGYLYLRGGFSGYNNCQIWLTAGKGTLIQFSLMGGYIGISSVIRIDGHVGFGQGLGGTATMDKIRTIVIGASAGFTAAGTIQIYGR